MAQTGKNKLRRWEFPAGSGIRVREIINRYSGRDCGLSFKVTIPARVAGLRQYKQFGSTPKIGEGRGLMVWFGFSRIERLLADGSC